jgi:hypothetical protein
MKQYTNYISTVNGAMVDPVLINIGGATFRYIDQVDNYVNLSRLKAIVESQSDIVDVANKLGVNSSIVKRAKEHAFIEEHLVDMNIISEAIPVNTQFRLGRFSPQGHIVDTWHEILQGNPVTATKIDELKRFILHEYMESKFMDKGIPFRVDVDQWSPFNYGAHELAAVDNVEKPLFFHWDGLTFQRNRPSTILEPDYSNINDLIKEILIIEGFTY